MEIPAEFTHFEGASDVPWDEIAELIKKKARSKGVGKFQAFTDAVIEVASAESMKTEPNETVLALGMEVCLVRGRFPEALFMSAESDSPTVLSLKAVVLFTLSDVEGLMKVVNRLGSLINDNSSATDRVRLSIAKVLYAAAKHDTSVIECVMEFDGLLEEYPDQVESPLTETMFALYVVGALLREVGQTSRATRLADTLEGMAERKKHRAFRALVENLRGNICNYEGQFEQAEKHYL
ncbi:MAG: hypothetical protein HXY34_08845, partial [Candidatus Thorarchaeota archaeon]|nr:hypothetical protein [Candidatus Thorarchaeota archaeon]